MKEKINLCDGCNVREPHEHRCHVNNCDCTRLMCQVQQDKITLSEAAKIARDYDKKRI